MIIDCLNIKGGLAHFGLNQCLMINSILKPKKILPIFQPATVNVKLVDSSIIHVSKYHKISDFELTNQNGQKITQEFYSNKIYVFRI